jgi:hypothetical protein
VGLEKRCPIYLLTRDTFFDWRGTGLATFATPGSAVYSNQPFATEETVNEAAALFFGGRPTKLEVDTRFHRRIVKHSEIKEMWPAFQLTQFVAPQPLGQLVSEAQIFVPKPDVISRFHTRADLISYVEQTPDSLYPLRMKFTSTIETGPDGHSTVVHRCQWESTALLRPESPRLFAKISDPTLHGVVIGTNEFSSNLWTWYPGDEELSGRVSGVKTSSLTEKAARMDLVLGDGKTVVASMPFSFYDGQR